MTNYRVITISILDETLLDIAEFRDLIDADNWARGQQAARWDAHCVYVGLDSEDDNTPVYPMARRMER